MNNYNNSARIICGETKKDVLCLGYLFYKTLWHDKENYYYANVCEICGAQNGKQLKARGFPNKWVIVEDQLEQATMDL